MMENLMRLDAIETLINDKGFASVNELSDSFSVSKVTIRRDLRRLEDENRVRRTFGGAVALHISDDEIHASTPLNRHISEDIDALILATPVPDEQHDGFISSIQQYQIPIVSESIELEESSVTVALDNYQAAYDLGLRTGYFAQTYLERISLLDLTHFRHTTRRSAGFVVGLEDVFPDVELVVSLNAEASFDISYQLTRDALEAYPEINMIFAVNDTSAAGAYKACLDMNISPDMMTIVTFGLEGNTMKSLLHEGTYFKIGLAMFPEIVAWYCLQSCIHLHQDKEIPKRYATPYAILSSNELQRYYRRDDVGNWTIRWDNTIEDFDLSDNPANLNQYQFDELPNTVGFIKLFFEHEWYQNITGALLDYCRQLGIELRVIDADQTLRLDKVNRALSVARQAYDLINDGDVIFLSGGEINEHLAQEIVRNHRTAITVIMNSIAIFNILSQLPQFDIILTGGVFNPRKRTLIGAIAEDNLRDIRVDKAFIAVAGMSFNFGFSHDDAAEVTFYRTLLQIARKKIVLVNASRIGLDAVAQIGALDAIDTLVTDDGLSASTRIAIRQKNVEIIIASDLS